MTPEETRRLRGLLDVLQGLGRRSTPGAPVAQHLLRLDLHDLYTFALANPGAIKETPP